MALSAMMQQYLTIKEENKDKDIQFGKSEGVIWFGTPDAIKAAS